jgi:hypothetical protein
VRHAVTVDARNTTANSSSVSTLTIAKPEHALVMESMTRLPADQAPQMRICSTRTARWTALWLDMAGIPGGGGFRFAA